MNTKMTKAELLEELKTAHQRIADLERASIPAEGEALFSRVFQVSPSLMALTDVDTGKYVEINGAFLNTLGYTHEEVIGKTSAELNIFVDFNQRTILLERLQRQGYLWDEFVSVRTKAGEIRYGILTGELIQVQKQKFALIGMNDITNREKAEQKLKAIHERLLEAQQLAHIGNWEWDLQKQALTWSEEVYRIFGVSPTDFAPSVELFEGFVHPEDKEDFLRQRAHMLDEKHFAIIAHRIILPGGEVRHVQERTQLIVDESGTTTRVIGTIQDITERKQAEDALRVSEDKFKYVFEHSIVGKSITLPSGDINVNQAFCDMLGYTQVELQSKKWQQITHPDDIEMTQREMDLILSAAKDSSRFMKRFLRKDGTVVWVDLNSSLRRDKDGKPLYFISSTVDITERKQAEDSIRLAESRYHALIENAPDGIVLIGTDFKFKYVSPSAGRIFGYDINADHELSPDALTHPDDLPMVIGVLADLIEHPEQTPTIQYRFLHKDGDWRWIESTFSNLLALPSVEAIVINFREITERKQTEMALQASEENYRKLAETSDSAIAVLDREGRILYANPVSIRVVGESQLVGMTIHDLFPGKIADGYLAVVRRVIDEQITDTNELQAAIKGRLMWLHANMSPIKNSDGSTDTLLLNAMDITDQRHTLEQIESLAKFPSENPGPVLRIDTSGKLLYANDASFAFLTEWSLEVGKQAPDDVLNVAAIVLETGHDKTVETIHKDRVITLDFILLQQSGYINVYGKDITYRKTIERELIRVNERFTELAEYVSDIFWVVEPQTFKSLYVSPAFSTVMGQSEEAVAQLPNGYLDMVLPEDRHIFIEKRELEAQGFETNVQYRIRRPDESIRWIRDRGTPILDSEGRVVRVVGIASDFTEQVESAARVHESDMRFRQIAETIPEVFWIFDHTQQSLVYTSPAYEEIWGYVVKNLYEGNRLYIEAVHPEDRGIMSAVLERQARGEATDTQYRIVQFNGSVRWIHDRSFPVFDETNGAVLRTIGIAADITERRRVGEALRDNEERLRLSLEAAKQGLYDLNVQTGEAIVNREYAEMLGYDPETFVETNQAWIERLHPDDMALTSQTYLDYVNGLIPEYRVEFRQRTKDGNWKWILSLGKLVEYDASGKPLRLLGTHTDITEIKQAQIELQKRASRLALINDVSREIAGVLDIQDVLDQAARLLCEEFDYHHVGLFTLENSTGELVMRSKAGEYVDFFPEDHRIKLGDGVVGSVGLSGQMILSNHVQDDPYYLNFNPQVILTQSELSLPIKIAGEVVGVLDVQSPQPNAFSEEDIKVLSTLVDQVAVALENARLYGTVQKELADRKLAEEERQKLIRDLGERVKELTVLHQSARLFQNTALSESETLQALAEIMPAAWKYHEIAVARVTVGDKAYSTTGFVETEWMQKTVFKLSDDRNAAIEVAYLEERPAEYDGPFLREECELIETLAGRLQTALTRQSMERDLNKRTEDLANLVEAGRALSGTLDPGRIYPLIYNYISNSMPCDFLVLSSFDPQTELIKCEYIHSAEGPQDVSRFPLIPLEPPNRGTQSLVIRSGESLLLSDYDNALKTATTTVHFNNKAEIIEASPDDEEHTRSAIIVPLKVNGVVAGALQVFSNELNAHTQNHLRFVEALAFHASAALSNAKLFSELEERVQQRTIEVQDLYDNAPAGYHSLDANGNITLINQTELNWLGYTREEVIGRNIAYFLTPDSLSNYQEVFPIFKHRGSFNALEMNFRRKDGSAFPVLVNSTVVKDGDGNYLMTRSTVFDNTERRNAELALLEREEIYRALFESANDAIFMISPDGVILRVNPHCQDLLGYTADELIGHMSGEFIATSDQDDAENVAERLLTGEHLSVYDRHFIRKDGSVVDTEVNLSLIRDETGRPKFIQSVVRDISARKQAENALRESEKQNRLLFEESPEAVMLFDQNGRLVRTNHAFNSLTGVESGEFIGHLITEIGLLPQDLMNSLALSTLEAFDHDDRFAELEFKLKNTKGEFRDINTRIFPLDLQGQRHYLASIHDITTSKRAEETLRLANAEMERALRLKDEFLANMSHELRTPLNAVLGISESLLEQISGPLNSKQQKYLQTVLESAQHLLALINDILDLAKVNAGRIELDINKADIGVVAHTSLRMIKELAQKKEISVTLKIDPAIKMAWLDERRLKQMLVNLLSNAVKFTLKGGRIGLDIQKDQNNKALHFIVWDTGIGIDQNDLRLLFQPFVQLDAGLARGSQGTGLGLVLVKQMARLHGGSVTVESEPGKGSRFIITLPWVNAVDTEIYTRHAITPPVVLQETSPVLIPVDDDRPLILIVEDTEAVTMLINDYLQQYGYRVITAKDGFEGIARAAENKPDLILMDVMMPELDGLETTRRIRKDNGLLDVPIIALTALAMAGDRERCLAAGMNDYISKPVKLKELLTTVEHYLNISKDGSQ